MANIESTVRIEEDSLLGRYSKIIAESFGTFLVVSIVWGAIVFTDGKPYYPSIILALVLIIIVESSLQSYSPEFNPAATITSAISGDLACKRVPVHIMAQIVGCLLALGIWTLCCIPFGIFLPLIMTHEVFMAETLSCLALVLTMSTFRRGNERMQVPISGIISAIILVNMPPYRLNQSSIEMTSSKAAMKTISDGFSVYVIAPVIGCTLGGFIFKLNKYLNSIQTLPGQVRRLRSD